MCPKTIFKVIAVLCFLGLWGLLSFLIWKPLFIPIIILFSGYGSTHLRNGLWIGGYIRSIASGLIWGIVFAFGIYFLNNLLASPVWWRLVNYFLGLYGAGHVGFRNKHEAPMLEGTKIESFFVIAQFASIISYVLVLVLLHLA